LGSKQLLVLTYHYPPDGAVGGMRWAGLTKHLRRLGWETAIVTAAAPDGTGDMLEEGAVNRLVPYPTLNDAYRSVVSRLRSRSGRRIARTASTAASVMPEAARFAMGSLRREVSALLDFPDPERGWIIPAVAQARAILRLWRAPILVSTGPPHSVHIAARLISAEYSIPWFLDFRDPWARVVSDNSPWRPFDQSRLARAVIPRLERVLIGRADGVIANTPELASAFEASYPASRVHTLRNGVDLEDYSSEPARRRPRPVSICHVGTLYGNRSIAPVLNGIVRFREQHPGVAPQDMILELAGHIEERQRKVVDETLPASGLQQSVRLLGKVSREEADRVVGRAGLAVVLAQGQPLQVPSKLYECAARGVRTIVIAERDSASAREATRIGVETCPPDDVSTLASIVASVWKGDAHTPRVDRAAIDYSRRAAELDEMLCHAVTALNPS